MVRMATIVTQVRPAVYQDHEVVITLLDFLAADEHQQILYSFEIAQWD